MTHDLPTPRRTPWPLRIVQALVVLVALLGIAAILSAMAGVAVYQYVYDDRIFLGARAAGLDLGGLTRAQAAQMLREHVGYFDTARIRFTYEGKSWEATPSELGGWLPADAMVEEAWQLGRRGSLTDRLLAQAVLYRVGVDIPLRSEFNRQPTVELARRMAREIDRPGRNASLTIRDLRVETLDARTGLELDQAAIVTAVENRIRSLTSEPIALTVTAAPPLITDVSAAKATTERILSGPITLTFQDKRWTFTPQQLANMIVFYQEPGADGKPSVKVRLTQGPLEAWIAAIPPQITREPENAAIVWDPKTQRVVATKASVTGYQMDVAATLAEVNKAILSTERTLPVVFVERRPAIDSTNLDALGIKELVVRGTTQFKGSPPERIQNIRVAAEKFQNILVPPGAVFSFGEHLGDVTPEEGYAEALIIVGNRTEMDYGGGICQVSTTAFRAAFFGGFPIVERYPHAYRVSYYETGIGPGLDATVYTPHVDFKFRNDSQHWLLIRTEMNVKNAELSFLFYGTKPGREVVLEGPRITKEMPAKPPVYQRDDKLKAGEIKQVDWAHAGAEVTAVRLIKQGGAVVKREEFRSIYQPWQDVFLVGPGTPIPNRSGN